jgi:hypothetical protein
VPLLPYLKKKLKWQEEKSHLEIETACGKYPQQVIAPNSEVTTTMKPKHVHCVLIVPNGPTPPPSQAIDATTSKLVGINNLTPLFEVVVVSYVSIITNKHDTTNQNNNMAPMGIAITYNPKPIV